MKTDHKPLTESELAAIERTCDRGGLPDCWVDLVGKLTAEVRWLRALLAETGAHFMEVGAETERENERLRAEVERLKGTP